MLPPGGEFDRERLVRWGEELGARLDPPAVITLEGDLGAGKTTMVQAIARGAGVVEPVTSPTYALVHRYEGRAGPFYHLDLFRLEDEAHLTALSLDDLLSVRSIVAIEWPQLAERLLGRIENRLRLRLSHVATNEDLRAVEVVP
ncbi:MAG: tRNA (adenosine(37)-N6)-threonylcarbamoyltransferase complex ATPase subunit type 1 TsaE [Gemmatimonadota bacterium]